MNYYGSRRLSWSKNKLYLGKQVLFEVVPDSTHKGMFRIKWPDGVLSEDLYNLSHAKDNSVKLALKQLNNGVIDSK